MMAKNKLGMLLFISSEAFFFALLILAYASFRSVPQEGPTAATSLDPLTTGFFSLFLLASSFTIWRASKNQAGKHSRRALIWLAATILLGAVFLIGQGLEWSQLLHAGASVSRNLFGTTFFTLTGLHGLHVAIGLLALGILLVLAWAGRSYSSNSSAVEVLSIYWHFVDVVWVVIFAVVYLWILVQP